VDLGEIITLVRQSRAREVSQQRECRLTAIFASVQVLLSHVILRLLKRHNRAATQPKRRAVVATVQRVPACAYLNRPGANGLRSILRA
jgi:hypothetical protein